MENFKGEPTLHSKFDQKLWVNGQQRKIKLYFLH